jgi:hypothetical protein
MTSNSEWNAMMEGFARQAKDAGLAGKSLSDRLQLEYAGLAQTEYFSIYEPRKIYPPSGYLSFKCVAAGLWSAVCECHFKMRHGIEQIPTEISACGVAYQILNYRVPVYFVAEDFIRAVAATELPSDFVIGDLHWPMPGMVLGFPTNFMKEYMGRETCYVHAASIEANENFGCPAMPFLQKITIPTARVGWHWYTFSADHNLESFVGAYHSTDRVDQATTMHAYVDYTSGGDEVRRKSDQESTELVSALMLKLLVILNTRPNLVVTGTCERPVRVKHGIERSAVWSPNVIGGKYRMLRGPVGIGTHATPRWHWRAGHLTHQRKGSLRNADFVSVAELPRTDKGDIAWEQVTPDTKAKFWACHERKWLEPTLVNFDPSAGTTKESTP